MFVFGLTDVGKVRSQNQDAIFVSAEPVGPLPNLFVVADGMGGHNAGDVASRHAIETFVSHIREKEAVEGSLDLLVSSAAFANQRVYEYAMTDPSLHGMGTTLTACVIHKGKCMLVHIGDSRAYMISEGFITQLTVDHSYVNEMVKAGYLTPSQARAHPKKNVVTRVLGVDPDMQADGYIHPLEHGCTLLLCSDGLNNMLTDETINKIVSSVEDTEESARLLVSEANARGGNDNISVVLIKY